MIPDVDENMKKDEFIVMEITQFVPKLCCNLLENNRWKKQNIIWEKKSLKQLYNEVKISYF